MIHANPQSACLPYTGHMHLLSLPHLRSPSVYLYNSSCRVATSTTLVSLLSLLSPASPFFAFISPFSFCSILSKIHLKGKHQSSPHSPHSSFLALNDPRPAPFLVARFTAVLTPTNQNKHQVSSISFVHTA